MINLFSDTATLPTPNMLRAMAEAPLGDEQRGNDPSVNRLQAVAAERLHQEAALLVPTATMANQIAMQLHAPNSEILCHENSHVYNFEGGGAAANAGAQIRPLAGEYGVFSAETLQDHISPDDPHFAQSRLVVIENTSNQGGGSVWPDAVFQRVVEVSRAHSLRLHLDGARLFNASVRSGREVAHWSARVDSVQVCFSKGLGCPFGAVLAGDQDFIKAARFVKQRLGGALRQAGVIAGAMLYAMENHVERLAEDHERLDKLAASLQACGHFRLWPHETNILYFQVPGQNPHAFAAKLGELGVSVSVVKDRLRVCTHLGVSDADVEEAAQLLIQAATPAPGARPKPPTRAGAN